LQTFYEDDDEDITTGPGGVVLQKKSSTKTLETKYDCVNKTQYMHDVEE
jgi:hypothetical protein